jgi:hypothetical protein
MQRWPYKRCGLYRGGGDNLVKIYYIRAFENGLDKRIAFWGRDLVKRETTAPFSSS